MIMREEDSNWFTKWEDELPPPEDLTPISQTLISTDLALAFDIQAPPNPHRQVRRTTSNEFDSSSTDLGGGGSAGADEPARTLKRPRLVWTPQLHKRFVDAVAHLGIKNAVPKTIMQLMSVDGLTRENVASHLQKYRLYLKRMQGIGNGGCGGGSGDPAADHLFASSPVPAHFLGGGAGGYVTSPAAAAAIHHQQVAAMVAGGGGFQQSRGGQVGHFASPAASGGAWQFENPFVSRQAQMGHVSNQNSTFGYVEDFESGASANGRRVLTLFPTTG